MIEPSIPLVSSRSAAATAAGGISASNSSNAYSSSLSFSTVPVGLHAGALLLMVNARISASDGAGKAGSSETLQQLVSRCAFGIISVSAG